MISYYKPYITDEMINAVVSSIESGWLTQGKIVEEFENRFAELNGSKYAIAVNNATIGLTILLDTFYINKIYIPSYTFTATYQAAYKFDITIKDIEEDYIPRFQMSRVDKYIDVSFAGKLREFNTDIHDHAHRFPDKRNSGNQVFSFYANKLITTGEGGMICTDDENKADECKKLRQHGRSKIGYKENPVCRGYNAKMTDFQAAMGLEQLKIIDILKEVRQEIADRYNKAFKNTELWIDDPADHHYHLYVIRSDKRKQIQKRLKENEIGFSRHYKPLGSKKEFPNAWKIWKKSLSLPIYPYLTKQEQHAIISAVLSGLKD